jgi:hypothetical protein
MKWWQTTAQAAMARRACTETNIDRPPVQITSYPRQEQSLLAMTVAASTST